MSAIAPQPPPTGRTRVLFVAEAVTLAHAARPVVLARQVAPSRYDVSLAWSPRYQKLFGPLPFQTHTLDSIPVEQFLRALAKGTPLYDFATLERYVRDDLDLLRRVQPDVVVGDFRLSLHVSAALAGVPYIALANAYWSPYARQRWPFPDNPLERLVGATLATGLFKLSRPLVFAAHTVPMNRLRKAHGLPSLGRDIRNVYIAGDYVLYADVPELVPIYNAPPTHRFLGPVLWSPQVAKPTWWDELPADRPIVYVTLGSSGPLEALSRALEALKNEPVTVLAATAGRTLQSATPANARLADYLPGDDAAARAAVVVCNGGSPTAHQALAAGRPVLGLAANMDQHLNMQYTQDAGAGLLLRCSAQPAAIRARVRRLLNEPAFSSAARKLADVFHKYDPAGVLARTIDEAAPQRPAAEAHAAAQPTDLRSSP